MAEGVRAEAPICFRCGSMYSKRKGNFPVNYSSTNKGIGYLPICKNCVDAMYSSYLQQCGNEAAAVRQMCRKLDLYWNDRLFEQIAIKASSRTMMSQYLNKINGLSYAGKCYDDTLIAENSLWSFAANITEEIIEDEDPNSVIDDDPNDLYDIDDDVKAFWGSGYTNSMYHELEQRRLYWMSRFPEDIELDIGTEAIIRQICSLELDINRDRAAGKSVDKSVNALNNLLGSANMKPAQQKSDNDNTYDTTPMGVWIKRWENYRPIPEPDPEFNNENKVVRYITIWFLGHLAKMLNLKNVYSKLYDEEMAARSVTRPEFDGDDEELFDDIFGESGEPDDEN